MEPGAERGLVEGLEGLVAGGLRLEGVRLQLGVQGLGKARDVVTARPLPHWVAALPAGGALEHVRQK